MSLLLSPKRVLQWFARAFRGAARVPAVILFVPWLVVAQPTSPPQHPQQSSLASDSVNWSALSANQQRALRPLEAEWASIDIPRRLKWLEIADRFPRMAPAEQARIQNRMAEWAKLTPRERGEARMNFREVQQVPAKERIEKWEAYKALPPEQRKQLAAKAAPPVPQPGSEGSGNTSASKSNVVPNPSYAPRPKPVAPTVAQAQPGATTNLITKRPNPPIHQPAGLPKIAVTPGFVDQATLLPKRGPQGAAPRAAQARSAALPAAPASRQ